MSFLPDSPGFGPDEGRSDWDKAEYGSAGQRNSVAFDSGVFTEDRKAWHDKGVVIPDDVITAERALDLAKLAGWDLQKHPAFVHVTLPDGREVQLPMEGRFGHVRMDTLSVLGDVGSTYTSLQNERAFDWADALVGGAGCHYKTAISLNGGAQICLQLEVPFEINLPDGRLRSFLFLSNSHDGSSAITAGFWNERLVCKNTLKLAKRGGIDRINIRHTQSAEGKLAEAQRALGLAQGAAERAEKLATQMITASISAKEFDALVAQVFPMSEKKPETAGERRSATIALAKRDAVRAAYNGEAGGQAEIKGTEWGAYNAFSAVASHQAATTQRQAEAIFNNLMSGNTAADRALELLVRA